jgi:hypothetical protein
MTDPEIERTKLAHKVGRLVRLLLGTNNDGEVIATLSGLKRTLSGAGLDHYDFAAIIENALDAEARNAVTDNWRHIVQECRKHPNDLTDKERAFLAAMSRWRGEPSEKQLHWLADIWESLKSPL